MWRHYAKSLESEHSLAEVIGQMVGAAQQDGETIARSIFREICFRYGRVPLEPIRPRNFLNPFHNSPFTVFHAWRTCSCEGMSDRDLSGFETKATSNSG